jgi:D-alanyl-D-alanine carboxypeptidase
MVLEDRTQHEGVASWYCKNHCSARYPTHHAASNDFPIGTTVRVRNLENGRSVDVKVISRWGQPAGRVIDLSWSAFAALGSSNAGLARVNVSLPKPKVLGVSLAPKTSKVEVIPNLRVSQNGTVAFPSITPRPFYVIDQGSGTALAEHSAETAVPIASLTKLMTAVVFLDTKPDLKQAVTYLAEDQTPYAYLRVKPGDTILLRDLFYSLLVGSANNAAPALVRSTGISQADFVARMNLKAQEWGMTNTKFVDVHGLDPANVSSARDIATLTAKALHDYEPIRFVSVKRDYTFKTLNTNVSHNLKTTDKILGSGMLHNSLIITGGKTGFLDESKYTYALRTAHKTTGAQVIVVLLGSSTSAGRFKDAAAITNWAFQNFTWGG